MTPTESSEQSTISLYFAPELRAWRGQMSLPMVFWGYGVTTSLVLVALHAVALNAGHMRFQQALILISTAYTIWVLIAIWRCAANAVPLWCTLTGWLTVAWALNTTFVLFFLELVLRYVRR